MQERFIPEAGQVRRKYDQFRPFGDAESDLPEKRRPSLAAVSAIIKRVRDILPHHGNVPKEKPTPDRFDPNRHQEYPIVDTIGRFDDDLGHK